MRALEAKVGALPPGYLEFMTTLGEGTLSDTIRLYTPEHIAAESADRRAAALEEFTWRRDILKPEAQSPKPRA